MYRNKPRRKSHLVVLYCTNDKNLSLATLMTVRLMDFFHLPVMKKDMTVFPNLKPEDRNTYRLGNIVTITQDSETIPGPE
jgi:hypothetical protein